MQTHYQFWRYCTIPSFQKNRLSSLKETIFTKKIFTAPSIWKPNTILVMSVHCNFNLTFSKVSVNITLKLVCYPQKSGLFPIVCQYLFQIIVVFYLSTIFENYVHFLLYRSVLSGSFFRYPHIHLKWTHFTSLALTAPRGAVSGPLWKPLWVERSAEVLTAWYLLWQ